MPIFNFNILHISIYVFVFFYSEILDNVFYTNKDSLDLDISNSIRTYLCGNKIYPAKSFDLQKLPLKKVVIADGEAEMNCLVK